jgi:hypothetical protein
MDGYLDGALEGVSSVSSELSQLRKVIITAVEPQTVRIALREFFGAAAERHVA